MKSLKQRQLRSWLTMLGIVIGIAAVVSLLSIGQGFNDQIQKQLSGLGSNTVFVAPISESQGSNAAFGGSSNIVSTGKLYDRDAERIERVPGVEEVARLLQGRGTIEFKEKIITATIMGVEPGIFEKTTLLEVEEGRFITPSDQRVVVVGATMAEDGFGRNKIGVNSVLTLNGVKFRVIGILKKTGGGFGVNSQLDNAIMVPFTDARDLFKANLAPNEIGAIVVKVQEGGDVQEVVDKMALEVAASHKVRLDQKDFSIISPKTVQDQIGSIIGMVTLFLGAIAGISLVVGGVGIANIMFTSVVERTREIGTLKAIGAQRDDILHIFIIESGVLGGAGGLIGVVVGFLLVGVASLAGVPAALKPEIALFSLLFSFVVGVVSGYIPARRASNLAPVDALRYE